MSLVLAVARHHPGNGVFGLYAEPQPVGTVRGAGQPAHFLGQPVDVRLPRRRGLAVVIGAGDVLGQVLAQVADAAIGVRRPGQQALQVVLVPEPQDVGRLAVHVTVHEVERFLPRRKQPAVVRIDVADVLGRPAREMLRVQRHVVFGPPELVVGGGPHLAHDPARDRTSNRGVQVRRQAALGLDRGEVLHVIAGAATQVLPEPIHQLGEMQRIKRRPPVVVAVRVHGHALRVDSPVGRQREGEEHRRPVGLAIRCGEHAADRAVLHRQPGQLGGVLAAPGRAHPASRLVLVGLVVALGVVGCGLMLRFGVEVPPLPALLDAQPPGPLGTWRAAVRPRRATGDRDHLDLAFVVTITRLRRHGWSMPAPVCSGPSTTSSS
jgi:hypothetical protein